MAMNYPIAQAVYLFLWNSRQALLCLVAQLGMSQFAKLHEVEHARFHAHAIVREIFLRVARPGIIENA